MKKMVVFISIILGMNFAYAFLSPGRYRTILSDKRVIDLVLMGSESRGFALYVEQIVPVLKQDVVRYILHPLVKQDQNWLSQGVLVLFDNNKIGGSFPLGLLIRFNEPLSKKIRLSVQNDSGQDFTFDWIGNH